MIIKQMRKLLTSSSLKSKVKDEGGFDRILRLAELGKFPMDDYKHFFTKDKHKELCGKVAGCLQGHIIKEANSFGEKLPYVSNKIIRQAYLKSKEDVVKITEDYCAKNSDVDESDADYIARFGTRTTARGNMTCPMEIIGLLVRDIKKYGDERPLGPTREDVGKLYSSREELKAASQRKSEEYNKLSGADLGPKSS